MIDQIKEELKEKTNKKVKVVVYESRSRKVEYEGILKKLYPHIFILEIDGIDMSFSYSDILTKKIIFK